RLPAEALLGGAELAADLGRVAVVARDGELPVAEHVVELEEVAGGGARGSLRVEALVELAGDGEAGGAARGGDELPHPAGTGPAVRVRVERALDHGEVLQLVRHPFLGQDLLDHREVRLGALADRPEVAGLAEEEPELRL